MKYEITAQHVKDELLDIDSYRIRKHYTDIFLPKLYGTDVKDVVIIRFTDSFNPVDETASQIYMNNKKKSLEKFLKDLVYVKIDIIDIRTLGNNINEIMGNIKHKLNYYAKIKIPLIVQRPLPKLIDKCLKDMNLSDIMDLIDYNIEYVDIDCSSSKMFGQFMLSSDYKTFKPCTVQAIEDILYTIYKQKEIDIDFEKIGEGKSAVVIGRSNIVGKPTAHLLSLLGYTVTLVHSKTDEYYLKSILANADLIVTAVGIPKFLDMDKMFVRLDEMACLWQDLILIDVGINRDEDGKICGDIDKKLYSDNGGIIIRYEHEESIDLHYTPVPKGVGPLTVLNFCLNTAMLLTKE